MMPGAAVNKRIVDPGLYSKEYFLSDNEGWREYLGGLDSNIHPKFARALEIAGVSEGDNVLDIGCGRGELLYYCAMRRARALGIDYSASAIDIARLTIAKLPDGLKSMARAEVAESSSWDAKEKFNIVFMIETLEHMYDWQLADTFKRLETALADDGRIIIITPNHYYEKYLSPAKRVLDLPLNLFKIPFRMLKTKYRDSGFAPLVRKAFRFRPDRGDVNRLMHVNVATPSGIRRLLNRFDVSVWCEDPSRNPLSLIARRWWGRDIVAVARKRRNIPKFS
jgi:SAM-dependent methyltransferase